MKRNEFGTFEDVLREILARISHDEDHPLRMAHSLDSIEGYTRDVLKSLGREGQES